MGRRKGGKNRTKEEIEAERLAKESQPKRSRGRPKGSLNKPKQAEPVEETLPVPKKRGRKKGQKSSYTVSPAALAQRRNNLAPKYARTDEEREYNARLIEHIMRIHEIASHADRHDLDSLRSCFAAYIRLCQEDGFSVSNLAAYSAMGFGGYEHFTAFYRKDDPEIREFCQMVKATCSMFRESMVSDNKLNPVIGIFWQRNFDGLRNDTEQVQSALEQDEDYAGGSKAYKEKYRNLIGE